MDTREAIPEETAEPDDELSYHGGNINTAKRLFPDAPLPWIDLSTGINPRAYPIGPVSEQAWRRLPDSADLEALESVARIGYGVTPDRAIVAGPGTQALIQWLPRLFPARRVGILGATYGEHERCWRAAGADVSVIATPDAFDGVDVGVVVNPNNPDGRMVSPETLVRLASALAARGGLLIVDEAFIDVCDPRASTVALMPPSGLLALRSFGKSYGLAGLRLGFAIGGHEDVRRLRSALGPWRVSGPAVEIGSRALADRAWLSETRIRLADMAARMDAMLSRAGIDLVGGTPLFRLGRHGHAGRIFATLGRAGILTRPFRQRPDLLRLGFPGSEVEWSRLEVALDGWSA